MQGKAIQLIEASLKPMIEKGRKLERISIYVSVDSKLAQLKSIDTMYGSLQIRPNTFIPKGTSYLMENSGKPGRAFNWVVRNGMSNQ
jgi:hypothetical protein